MSFLNENNKSRIRYIPLRGKALRLPLYFPSISSVKTGLSPFDYFLILKTLKQPYFLVSAYDIDRSFQKIQFIELLKSNQKDNGPIILMDSGNYESYWLRDKNWEKINFNHILKQDVCDIAFSYDNQFPPDNIVENVAGIAESKMESQNLTHGTTIVPIVHCLKDDLNETVLKLYDQTNFTMVSIPERILGNGILERIATITKLRKELNKLDNYPFIHLLGTGNPLSLLLYSLAGADSFDGLEWCQTVVNSKTKLLYHFQQREMIMDECKFYNASDIKDYQLTTLGHNLDFYNNWMKQIHEANEEVSVRELLQKHFNFRFIQYLDQIWL